MRSRLMLGLQLQLLALHSCHCQWRQAAATAAARTAAHGREEPAAAPGAASISRSPASAAAPVLSLRTRHFSLAVFADCSAVATNLRSGAASDPGNKLLALYNRVSDDRASDWSGCTSASLVAPGVVRVAADHGYGTVDVGVSSAGSSGTGWVVFEILNTSSWHGDPFQKHINFGCLCPADMCPGGQYPAGASAQGRTVDSGKFQGFRGPSRAKSGSRSLRSALLMPQVHPGSLYHCGKSN